MKLTSVLVALFAAATVSCSSYANPSEDGEADDPTYVGPGSGGNNDDDDGVLPPGYSNPSASSAGSDSTGAK